MKTDALIRAAFKSYIPETTKFIIAQRVASVQDADLILIMENGRIAARGTHGMNFSPQAISTARSMNSRRREATSMNKKKPDSGSMKNLKRAFKKLFEFYPVLSRLSVLCIVFSAVVSAIPSIFIQNILSGIEHWVESGDWAAAKAEIFPYIMILFGLYVLSIIATVVETQLMAVMTQGYLNKFRKQMFDGMQNLPISYFDTHKHGDIMSFYTNDIDTLRMLISQCLPTFIRAGSIVLMCIAIMLISAYG
jgi:ABC-type multidrug transport system, ATPase and permease components